MRASVVGIAALTCGCSDIGSNSLMTSGMSAVVWVEAAGNGQSTVATELRAGGQLSTTYVELEAGDTLTTSVDGGDPVEMTEVTLLEYHKYETVIENDSSDATFTVALERTMDAGAPDSAVSLPEPFELDPLAETASRAAELEVTWTPGGSGHAVELAVLSPCVELYTDTVEDDPGSITIPAEALQHLDGQEDTCDLTVQVRVIEDGTLDSSYGEGGYARGIQLRTVTVSSTPE